MQCKNHPGEKGTNTCNDCGSWMCDRCSFDRGGRIFCPSCAAKQAANEAGSAGTKAPGYGPRTGRYISWGLLFLFSVVIPLPGLNYMYMGLVKRGLVAMIAFFTTIFLTAQFNGTGLGIVFWFAMPILMFVSIFDGFNIRRRINAGEEIADSVDDITDFIRRNRTAIIAFLLLLVVVAVITAVPMWLVGVGLAVLAIHVLFRKPK